MPRAENTDSQALCFRVGRGHGAELVACAPGEARVRHGRFRNSETVGLSEMQGTSGKGATEVLVDLVKEGFSREPRGIGADKQREILGH